MKVLWFGYMEEVVCDRDDLILNPLFNFEPVKRLEYWRDVTCLVVRVTGHASMF